MSRDGATALVVVVPRAGRVELCDADEAATVGEERGGATADSDAMATGVGVDATTCGASTVDTEGVAVDAVEPLDTSYNDCVAAVVVVVS